MRRPESTDKTVSENCLGAIRWLIVAVIVGACVLMLLARPAEGQAPTVNPYEIEALNERVLTLELQVENLHTHIVALEAENIAIKDTATTLGQLLAETGSK